MHYDWYILMLTGLATAQVYCVKHGTKEAKKMQGKLIIINLKYSAKSLYVDGNWELVTIDGPPHQIRSYTLLFSLFHYFLYIVDPPLCTPTLITLTCFIGLISLIWWTHVLWFTCFISILSIPNMHPPMVRPIMSPHTVQSGTFYSFTSDEPYVLTIHIQLACIYLSLKESPNQLPISVSPRIEI